MYAMGADTVKNSEKSQQNYGKWKKITESLEKIMENGNKKSKKIMKDLGKSKKWRGNLKNERKIGGKITGNGK